MKTHHGLELTRIQPSDDPKFLTQNLRASDTNGLLTMHFVRFDTMVNTR